MGNRDERVETWVAEGNLVVVVVVREGERRVVGDLSWTRCLLG